MTKPNDGGPAFPQSRREREYGENWKTVIYPGMSLRAYLAAKAINVIRPVYEVTSEPYKDGETPLPPVSKIRADIIAREACEVADALIVELERGVAETGETRQVTKGKFKRGNRVRVKSEQSKIYDLTGVIVSVHPQGPGRTQPMYDIRLDSGKSKGELVWRFEDELEVVEEGGEG